MKKEPTFSISSSSPDSMPSVADLTLASSPESKDSVARVLFQTPPQSTSCWERSAGISFSPSMDAADDQTSEVQSVLGSEGNTLTSLDLAVDVPTVLGKQQENYSIWDILREQNLSDTKVPVSTNSGSILPNDSPKPTKRARTASFSRQQRRGVFSMFDSSNNSFWPPRPFGSPRSADTVEHMEQNGFPLPVEFPTQSADSSWKPKAESLERECTALKEIIRVDSHNILNLKSAIEKFDHTCKQKTAEVESLAEELECSKQRIASLQERDVEQKETIRILKKEIDRLTELGTDDKRSPASHKADSAAQLRFENELFASQIIESEAELSKVRLLLKQKQQDCETLKAQLHSLESKMSMLSIGTLHSSSTVTSNAFQLTPSIENDLIDEVKCLAARLDVMEDERKEMAVRYEDELRQKESEIHEVVAMVQRAKEKQQHRTKDRVVVTQVSTADQELDKLQQTLREKDAEIEKLKGRVNEGPAENSSSGLCGFSPCDLSHCFCS